MSNEWFSKLAHVAESAGARLVVRSALNPMLWLCGVVCPTCWAAAWLLRGDPFVERTLILVSTVPVLTTCAVAVYFAICKPDRLQSESFQLRQQTLQLLESKGGRVVLDRHLLNEVMRPAPSPKSEESP